MSDSCNETEDYEKGLNELLEMAKTHGACDADECEICSVRDCPRKEPLHYHHDGCPACVRAKEKKKLAEITVHDSIHRLDEVTEMIYKNFGGKRTLWNDAWTEYHVDASVAEELIEQLRETGREVDITYIE